jgi:hypothetical protein
MGQTTSQVHFRIVYTPTPLGEIWNQAQPNFYSGWAAAVATFVLYDDGWRVQGWERENQ